MSNIPPKIQAFLDNHNLSALEFEPGSTPTAETAALRIGVPVGQIAKSILFKGKDGRYRLVVVAGDKKKLTVERSNDQQVPSIGWPVLRRPKK